MVTAFDLKHVKGVRAVALLWEGQPAGRIVANYSDNPMGSVCTATVHIWTGPLGGMPGSTGRAGGCGYDKFSAAVMDAFGIADRATTVDPHPHWEMQIQQAGLEHGNGDTGGAFEELGYQYMEVC